MGTEQLLSYIESRKFKIFMTLGRHMANESKKANKIVKMQMKF